MAATKRLLREISPIAHTATHALRASLELAGSEEERARLAAMFPA
jgi:hypothetical protein